MLRGCGASEHLCVSALMCVLRESVCGVFLSLFSHIKVVLRFTVPRLCVNHGSLSLLWGVIVRGAVLVELPVLKELASRQA